MNGKPSESSKRRFQSSPKVVAQIDLIKMNKNGDKEATQDVIRSRLSCNNGNERKEQSHE
ncbi:MAG: hypothetical protein ACP5D6_01150 [Kosmotogaceae bacterium]